MLCLLLLLLFVLLCPVPLPVSGFSLQPLPREPGTYLKIILAALAPSISAYFLCVSFHFMNFCIQTHTHSSPLPPPHTYMCSCFYYYLYEFQAGLSFVLLLFCRCCCCCCLCQPGFYLWPCTKEIFCELTHLVACPTHTHTNTPTHIDILIQSWESPGCVHLRLVPGARCQTLTAFNMHANFALPTASPVILPHALATLAYPPFWQPCLPLSFPFLFCDPFHWLPQFDFRHKYSWIALNAIAICAWLPPPPLLHLFPFPLCLTCATLSNPPWSCYCHCDCVGDGDGDGNCVQYLLFAICQLLRICLFHR